MRNLSIIGRAFFWSRRITREHRFIYKVYNNKIEIYSVKGHYK
ncbi:type II toxin-antitoxin system YoeB family toxin [Membranihabitans maritimus]